MELSIGGLQVPMWQVPLILIVFYLAFHVMNFFAMCWKLRAFKGPFALPIIGNVYNPQALIFLGYISKLRKRYGSVFTFFGLMRSYLIVCEPTAVRRILSDTKAFPKGSDYSDTFGSVFGEGLVTAKDEKHKKDRSVLGKYFIRKNVSTYAEMINTKTKEAIARRLPREGGSVDIADFFAILSLRVFTKFCLNWCYEEDSKRETEFAHDVSAGSGMVGLFVIMGLPLRWWMPGAATALKVSPGLMKDVMPVVEQRRKDIAAGKCDDLDDPLSAMLRENLPDDEMRDHLMTLVCAGHDTTAYFSAYMSYLLAANPDCQEKLRSEIRQQCGDRDVSADDVYAMKYMQMFMKEVMRYYSIIPCVSRTTTEEVTIKEAGITIPAGQDLLMPFFVINRDPTLWKNPGQFDPERFRESGDQFTSAKMGYFPFGYGTRVCIGNTLAYIESGIFMAHLLRQFEFKAEPGYKPLVVAGISLTTTNGVRVVLKPI